MRPLPSRSHRPQTRELGYRICSNGFLCNHLSSSLLSYLPKRIFHTLGLLTRIPCSSGRLQAQHRRQSDQRQSHRQPAKRSLICSTGGTLTQFSQFKEIPQNHHSSKTLLVTSWTLGVHQSNHRHRIHWWSQYTPCRHRHRAPDISRQHHSSFPVGPHWLYSK